MKLIIGFANKYYTLWSYEELPQYINDNYNNIYQSGVNHKYTYIKNISMDLDIVKKTFPNIEIDTELKGLTTFTREDIYELPDGYFWSGKYTGMLIDTVIEKDFNYCIWYSDNHNNKISDHIIKNSKYISFINKEETTDKPILKVGDVVELNFIRNGYNADEKHTECWTEALYDDNEIYVKCNGVKQVNGIYPYLMPIINGKALKTKNKTIKVEIIEVIKTNINNGMIKQYIRIK